MFIHLFKHVDSRLHLQLPLSIMLILLYLLTGDYLMRCLLISWMLGTGAIHLKPTIDAAARYYRDYFRISKVYTIYSVCAHMANNSPFVVDAETW